jgi:hypothetical protein
VEDFVGTRSSAQSRSHAQKFFGHYYEKYIDDLQKEKFEESLCELTKIE